MHSKNLVLFSDGTGNSAGKLFKTNVWRMYQALDLTDCGQLQFPRQFAYYDDGVGTSTFKPLAIVGGAFGVGLSRNVLDLYVFLCRTYQPGDKIYAFGFSRGAFTIRVLVELVMKQGLLRYGGSEADLQRWAREAYRAYRRETFPGTLLVRSVRWLRDRITEGIDGLTRRTRYEDVQRIATPGDDQALEIEFLGLWDTVDAYGLPFDQLTRAIDRYLVPLSIPTYDLDPRVKCARHALSLDDERQSFYPRLWTEKHEPAVTSTHVRDQRICQVWFAGVHSNVGGGYPDDSLSYVPLLWIMDEADRCALRFKDAIWEELRALSDENGPLNDSRKGLAGYYAYGPRRMESINRSEKVWIERGKVHESVLRRIRIDPDGYAPKVLSADFDVVRIDGEILPVDRYIDDLASKDPDSSPRPGLSWFTGYAQARERVFNIIWGRRLMYYLTLAVSLMLFSMPAWAPGAGVCQTGGCFLTAFFRWLDYFIPSFATAWTNTFASNPLAFALLLLALAGCFWLSHGLDIRISDRMRSVWYAISPLKPKAVADISPPPAPGILSKMIEDLRTNKVVEHTTRILTHRVLPMVFVLAMVGYALVMASQVVFAARSSMGLICPPAKVLSNPGGSSFSISNLCHDTGTSVVADQRYTVIFEIPSAYAWRDDTILADPGGYRCTLPWYKTLAMAAATPLRRHLTLAWFQPMVRIGPQGTDTYPLKKIWATPLKQSDCITQSSENLSAIPPCPPVEALNSMPQQGNSIYELRFVAHSTGALYLYLNDAIGPPFAEGIFYGNNVGCAKVTVTADR